MNGHYFCLFSITGIVITIVDNLLGEKGNTVEDKDELLHDLQRKIAINEFGFDHVKNIEKSFKKDNSFEGRPCYFDNCRTSYETLKDALFHLKWLYNDYWGSSFTLWGRECIKKDIYERMKWFSESLNQNHTMCTVNNRKTL